ncbi:RrF2 family transcriptional regulator [Chloroflexota bacterium]
MRLSTKIRYATRILLDLAPHKSSIPVTGKYISERAGISQSYLENLMGPLKSAGLVRTARGTGGGFILAKPPAQIKLSDIWEAMEGPLCLIDCTHDPDLCPRYEQCITSDIWKEAEQALNAVFESWSLEDMVHKSKLDRPRQIQD